MKESILKSISTLKVLFNISILVLTAWFSYQHGFYVGKLDGQANTNALQEIGFIPEYVDSNQYAIIR